MFIPLEDSLTHNSLVQQYPQLKLVYSVYLSNKYSQNLRSRCNVVLTRDLLLGEPLKF